MGTGEPTGNDPDRESRPVISLIRDIHENRVDPRSLSSEARGACVEYLSTEGYSAPEMAEILKVSDRTIRRDMEAIRAANAVERDPKLVGEMVWKLVREAETAISHTRRAARGGEARPADRIAAERACWTITRELTQTLQTLGYLPNCPAGPQGG